MFTSIHWRLQKCIHSADAVLNATGWSSNIYTYMYIFSLVKFIPCADRKEIKKLPPPRKNHV